MVNYELCEILYFNTRTRKYCQIINIINVITEITKLKDSIKSINDKFENLFEKKVEKQFLNEKLPEEPRKLHALCFNLRTEKTHLQRNVAVLESHIESIKSQLSLRDNDDKIAAQHIHKLQERIQQLNGQVDTLEKERKQYLEIAFRNSISSKEEEEQAVSLILENNANLEIIEKLKEENQEFKVTSFYLFQILLGSDNF